MGKRVLFVDDEPEVRAEFSLYLRKKGYDVVEAENGLQAFRLFRTKEPDIVLTDYDMPEINGIELLRDLKAIRPDIPVIMISGRADMRTAVEALKEQAFDFIEKPVDSNELLLCMRKALARQETMPQDAVSPPVDDRERYYGPINHVITGRNRDISALHVYRSLDEHYKKSLQDSMGKLLGSNSLHQKIVLVLSNVHYINNVGLNFLIDLYSDLKRRGHRVVLTQPTETVYRYLQTLGYLDFFKVVSHPDEAVETLEAMD